MEVINRISNGIHLDNNEYDQPVGTMRDNRNGLIYDIETGRYIWRGIKGTTSVLDLAANETFMGYVKIRTRHFIIVLNTIGNYVRIVELFFSVTDTITSTTVIWQTTNTNLNLNPGYPIRSMFGVYESDEIIRLYINDYHNQPRVINIAGTAPITVDEKFIELAPVMDNGYGSFKFVSELTGGSLKAGIYFFAWRLYKDGYYTDWSYLSTPVLVYDGSPGTTYPDYHLVAGAEPNSNTSKGVQIQIDDIDDDYDIIQVAAFYSNDLNSIAGGSVIYEAQISGTSVVVDYYGGEESNTVTISEAAETSLFISRCKDMVSTGKYNVIANITEREEINVTTLNSEGKHNKIDVQITPAQYGILLDTKAYETIFAESTRPLNGILPGSQELAGKGFIPGLYHYAATNVSYTDLAPVTVLAGNYFKPSLIASYISGWARMATVIKKYRKAAASAPYDLNTDYKLETSLVDGTYYNYKNPYFCNKLKGYPSGEKIRLGVLFLDKTGRPYFVRHLNNTETTYYTATIGPGDTRIPDRYEDGMFPICDVSGHDTSLYDYYKNTIGYVNYLSVSGLDITPIRNEIGAFMIVRCPIERQNLAYGALGFVYESGNDVFANFSFRAESNDTAKAEGIYVFYCPDDMFDLSGFSIQEGDRIVNRYYMMPFDRDHAEETGLEGYGIRMTGTSMGYNMYQKFYEWDNDTETGNAARGVEHDIMFYTKYRQGDGDEIVIDPRNPAKALRYRNAHTIDGSSRNSYITNLGIVVLDIEDTVPDVKGMFDLDVDEPRMLVCSIKRPKTTVYGGLSDSGLASSIYIPTGHYQEINAAVLADIEDGGSYVFNEIDVFGGDTFVCIWDFMRLMANEDLDGASDRYGHAMMMPIESRINLELRDGNHIGKDRAAATTDPADPGLRWKTGENKWEEFNYNDGYSTDNPGRHYLPIPANFSMINEFDTDIRYSDAKEYGEYEDSFRKFRPLNKYQVDKKFGPINNIRYKFNNLIYWQRECAGYIPIGERALISTELSQVVQLGVSGIFERNDQLVEFVGNSNQFGLVESNDGFHWYDSIKKLFISLTNSLKLTPDSIIHGLDSFFMNEVPAVIRDYDYPASGFGISGEFDPKEKIVYVSFKTASFAETIGFSIKDNKFTGFYDYNVGRYFSANNALYATDFYLNDIHLFNVGTIGTYFGVSYPRYFTIIVRDDSNIAKVFDHWEIIGNDEFFSMVNYALENTDDISEYLSGSLSRHVNQKLKYRNKRWFGNFPKIEYERLVGGYCKITFVNTNGADARFLQMKTMFREMI